MVLISSKYVGKNVQSFLWSLLVTFRLHISFSKYDLHLTQWFYFLGLSLGTVDMSVYLPSDKTPWDIAAGTFMLQTQPLMVCPGHVLIGQDPFLCHGYMQFCQLCLVIQSDMLNLFHSPDHLLFFFPFFFSTQTWTSETVSVTVESDSLQFPLPDVVITTDARTIHRACIWRVLGYLYPLVEPDQILCTSFI